MIARGPFDLPGILLASIVFLLGSNLPAAGAQGFTVTAIPVTTSPSGAGSIQFTASGIPFAGQLIVGCQYAGEESYQAQVKLPVCGAGPIIAYNVTAGQTLNGTIPLVPWGTPIPVAGHPSAYGSRRVLASGLLFVGALFLSFSLHRRRRWPSLLLFVFGALAVVYGVSACGGNTTFPPAGTYPYTMTATLNSTSPAILSAATSTTVKVTVP
jgi:hypothetical protein